MSGTLKFTLSPETFSIWRLSKNRVVDWAALTPASWFTVTRTADEISIVAPAHLNFAGGRCESGWASLKIEGPLPFDMVGVLAGVSSTLAAAGVSIFVVSTFDTDYLFVKSGDVARAVTALESAGHVVAQ